MTSLYQITRAEGIIKEGHIRITGWGRFRLHFTVLTNKKHYVFYDRMKNRWHCDCNYYTVQGKLCSHIIASKFYLKKIATVMEEIELEK